MIDGRFHDEVDNTSRENEHSKNNGRWIDDAMPIIAMTAIVILITILCVCVWCWMIDGDTEPEFPVYSSSSGNAATTIIIAGLKTSFETPNNAMIR